MAITDEELAEKQEYVQMLREKVAAEEAKRQEREAALVNDVTSKQLDAEIQRLEVQLQAAKDANKAAAVKEGAATVLEPVNADLVNAKAEAKAQDQAAAAAEKDKVE